MRGLILGLAVLASAAGSALGVINISLTADAASLEIGQQTVVHILAQGTDAGLAAVAGSVLSLGDAGVLEAVAGSFAWGPAFSALPAHGIPAAPGAPAADGGWLGFGSCQSQWPPLRTFAKGALVEVAHFTVRATGAGTATLGFLPGEFGGFLVAEVNQGRTLGTVTGVTISIVRVRVPGDVDGDGHVDAVDLLFLVDAFGSLTGDANYDARCDFNDDGAVDVVDLLDLVYNFGT